MDKRLRQKIYMMWWHMKDRCYNVKNIRYSLYGGRGVKVCDEWDTFVKFAGEVKEVKGYSEEGILNGELHLDKDYLDNENKVYSKEKCMFISKELNNKYKPNQMKRFIGTSPEGEQIEGYNQSEFARRYNLRQSTISECLLGKIKVHRGWTFDYL